MHDRYVRMYQLPMLQSRVDHPVLVLTLADSIVHVMGLTWFAGLRCTDLLSMLPLPHPPLLLPLHPSLLQSSSMAELEQKCRESEARTSSAQREAASNREALSSLMVCVQEQKALCASQEVWVRRMECR